MGSGYTETRGEQLYTLDGDDWNGFSPSFYIQADPRHFADVENAVIGPSLTTQAMKHAAKRTDATPSDAQLDHIRNVIGEQAVDERWHPEFNGFIDTVSPGENFQYLDRLHDTDINLHYPDHLENCMYGTLVQYKDTDRFADFAQTKDLINDYLPDIAAQIPVKKDFGLTHYRESELEKLDETVQSADLVEHAADQLNGNTVVITYDSSFLDRDTPAYPPSLLYHGIKEQNGY